MPANLDSTTPNKHPSLHKNSTHPHTNKSCNYSGSSARRLTAGSSRLKTILFCTILASLLLIFLQGIKVLNDFFANPRNPASFLANLGREAAPVNNSSNDSSNSNSKVYLRQVYIQERPKEEYLEKLFNSIKSSSSEVADKAQLRKAFNSAFDGGELYRIKKHVVDKTSIKEHVLSSLQSAANPNERFERLDFGYNIQALKRTNLAPNPRTSSSSNRVSASASAGGKMKYQGIHVGNADYTSAKNAGTRDKQPILKTGSELARIGSAFRSSKLGINRSFWRPQETQASSGNNVSESLNNFVSVKQQESVYKIGNPPTGEWKYNVNDGLLIPDVSDKQTIISLAQMSSNAYKPLDDDTWDYLGDKWRNDTALGWDSDGLRGYVFASEKNDTVVISIKGTSASVFMVGGGPTSVKDKLNDNRMFSCCCARVDYSWKTVCGCYSGGSKCNIPCLQESLQSEDLYVFAAAKIIEDVSETYPNAFIVLTGHSLGGSVAGLMGLTFGLPVTAFEAPGDLLAAKRLHLPMPPAMDSSLLPIYHIGHNTDPIYLGQCNGASSSCYYGGYAMESKCHVGKECIFDTAKHLKWSPDIRHHRIFDVLEYVLHPWESDIENTTIPQCTVDTECKDCSLWEFVDEGE